MHWAARDLFPQTAAGGRTAKGGGKHLLSLYSRLVLLNIRTDIKRVLVTVVSVAVTLPLPSTSMV